MSDYEYRIRYDFDKEGFVCKAVKRCGGLYIVTYGKSAEAALREALAHTKEDA